MDASLIALAVAYGLLALILAAAFCGRSTDMEDL